jgi:large subunit ribosomal protein L9
MEVILLEKIRNLGSIGEVVKVKKGYSRNYLVPEGKAMLATKTNIAKITEARAQLEAQAQEVLDKALARKEALEKITVTLPAKASEDGKLFGSIGTRDIATAITQSGIEVAKSEVNLPQGPLRQIGDYEINVQLHTDVTVAVKIKLVPV